MSSRKRLITANVPAVALRVVGGALSPRRWRRRDWCRPPECRRWWRLRLMRRKGILIDLFGRSADHTSPERLGHPHDLNPQPGGSGASQLTRGRPRSSRCHDYRPISGRTRAPRRDLEGNTDVRSTPGARAPWQGKTCDSPPPGVEKRRWRPANGGFLRSAWSSDAGPVRVPRPPPPEGGGGHEYQQKHRQHAPAGERWNRLQIETLRQGGR